jgi:hypothetical protein
LLIAQTKVINETFLKLFAVKAQPYLKKPWAILLMFFANNFCQCNYSLMATVAILTLATLSDMTLIVLALFVSSPREAKVSIAIATVECSFMYGFAKLSQCKCNLMAKI